METPVKLKHNYFAFIASKVIFLFCIALTLFIVQISIFTVFEESINLGYLLLLSLFLFTLCAIHIFKQENLEIEIHEEGLKSSFLITQIGDDFIKWQDLKPPEIFKYNRHNYFVFTIKDESLYKLQVKRDFIKKNSICFSPTFLNISTDELKAILDSKFITSK